MICSLSQNLEHLSLPNSPYKKLFHLGQQKFVSIISLSEAHGSSANALFPNPLRRRYARKIEIYLPG